MIASAGIISLGLYTLLKFIKSMKSRTISLSKSQQSAAITVQPIKPLVFDFFISNRPAQIQEISQENDIRSYFSQRLENNRSFKPRLNCKKLIEEPNFLLSVEKKKIKVMNGLVQRANPQKITRNHYKGSKVRSNTVKTTQQQEAPQENSKRNFKDKRVQSQQISYRSVSNKAKHPNFPFNLKHLMQTCKVHPQEFKREQHITGTSFPYYSYFSTKPQLSRKSSRKSQQSRRDSQRQRYFSTVDIKPFLE